MSGNDGNDLRIGFTRKHPGGVASACFAQTQPFWVNYPKQTAQQSPSSTGFYSRDTETQGYQRAQPKPTGSMMNPSKGWSRRVRGLWCSHMEPISHYGNHPHRSRNILPRSTAHPLPRRGAAQRGQEEQPFCCPFCHRAAGTPLSCWQLQQLQFLQFCFRVTVTSQPSPIPSGTAPRLCSPHVSSMMLPHVEWQENL